MENKSLSARILLIFRIFINSPLNIHLGYHVSDIPDIHGKQESVSTDPLDHGFRSAARIVCRHRSTIF